MRWPFSLLFGGNREARAAGDAGGAGAGLPGAAARGRAPDPAGPATSDSGPGAAASRPAAWREMPPLQRVVGEMSLTAPAIPFGRDLAGRRAPDPILRPLAHDVARDGPAGLVSGIATPLAAPVTSEAPRAAGPDLAPLATPAQRRAAGRPVASVATAPRASGRNETLLDGDPATAEAPSLQMRAALRSLPVVAPASATQALAATRVAAESVPAPARAVARSIAIEPTGAGVETSPGAPGAHVAVGGGPPEGATDTSAASPSAAMPAAAEEPDSASPPPLQRRTLGESRRLGLGAPLSTRPQAAGRALAAELPLGRVGRRGPTGMPTMAPPSVAPIHAAGSVAPLPILRVAKVSAAPSGAPSVDLVPADGATAVAAEPPADPLPGAANAGAAAGGGAGPLVPPTYAERPTVGSGAALRSEAAPGPAGADESFDGANAGLPATSPLDLAVSVAHGPANPSSAEAVVSRDISWAGDHADGKARGQRSQTAENTGGTGSTAAGGTAAGGTGGNPAVMVPHADTPLAWSRQIAGSGIRPTVGSSPAGVPFVVARLSSGPAASPQSALGTGLPGVAPTSAAPWPAPRPSPAASPARPSAARSEDLGQAPAIARPRGQALALAPVARLAGPVGSVAPAAPSMTEGEPLLVSRLAGASAGASPRSASTAPPGSTLGWTVATGFVDRPPSGPSVQRAVSVEDVSSEVAGGTGATSGTGSAAGGGAGQDYEEIADRVYDRIRSRFASELLLDRERMGLLIDG